MSLGFVTPQDRCCGLHSTVDAAVPCSVERSRLCDAPGQGWCGWWGWWVMADSKWTKLEPQSPIDYPPKRKILPTVTVIVIVRYAFPIQTFINRGFSLAMCHYQRVKTWNDNLSVDFPAKYINWPEIGVYGLSRILRQIDKPFDPFECTDWEGHGVPMFHFVIQFGEKTSYDMTLVRLELERFVQIPKIIQSTIDSKPLGRFLWWWIHSAHHVVTNRVEVRDT